MWSVHLTDESDHEQENPVDFLLSTYIPRKGEPRKRFPQEAPSAWTIYFNETRSELRATGYQGDKFHFASNQWLTTFRSRDKLPYYRRARRSKLQYREKCVRVMRRPPYRSSKEK